MEDPDKNSLAGKGEITISKKTFASFDMPIEVHFKDYLGLEPIKLTHELVFQGRGKWSTHSVEISEEKLNQFAMVKTIPKKVNQVNPALKGK